MQSLFRVGGAGHCFRFARIVGPCPDDKRVWKVSILWHANLEGSGHVPLAGLAWLGYVEA
jgi:hypothetical protein